MKPADGGAGPPTVAACFALPAVLLAVASVAAAEADLPPNAPTIRITERLVPPSWAFKQRLLLETENDAVQKFYARYFDERGWFKGHLTWGLGLGTDDILQGLASWPLLYALGGSDDVLRKYEQAFRGQREQLTMQKVEAAPAWGPIHDGFVAADDVFHIEEWYQAFNQTPLADPRNPVFRDGMLRFAGCFLNEGLPDGAGERGTVGTGRRTLGGSLVEAHVRRLAGLAVADRGRGKRDARVAEQAAVPGCDSATGPGAPGPRRRSRGQERGSAIRGRRIRRRALVGANEPGRPPRAALPDRLPRRRPGAHRVGNGEMGSGGSRSLQREAGHADSRRPLESLLSGAALRLAEVSLRRHTRW